MSSLVFLLISLFSVVLCRPNELPNRTDDYLEKRVNEVASVSCDMCLKAVYGINYNVIQLKNAAEDMVKKDCEALFHSRPQDIGKCIAYLTQKIEQYYDKVEPVIDTRHVCVKMRMCAPVEQKLEKSTEVPNITENLL